MMNMIRCILLTASLVIVPTINAFPQGNAQPGTRFSLYYILNNWKYDYPTEGSKLNQGVVGLNLALAPAENFAFDLGATLTNTSYSSSHDDEVQLSGLNDSRLRLTYFYTKGTKASLSLICNIPTGKTELDAEEYQVVTELSDLSRRFATRRYGQGLDVGAEWYILPQLREALFQIGGGYLRKGKFRVAATDLNEYKYGDEIYGKVMVTLAASPFGATAGVALKYFTEDKVEKLDVFQAGTATIVGATVTYSDLFDAHAGLSLTFRGKGKVRSSGEEVLSDEVFKSGRDEVRLFAGGAYLIAEKVGLLARFEYQRVNANDYRHIPILFRAKSHYLGAGAGASYQLSQDFRATGLATYYAGKIDDDFDLTGFGLVLLLTFKPM